MNAKHSSWLLIISLFYTFFVIYGSLVPLQFQAIPFDTALARFKEIPYLNLGIHSRADWVSNILLFIPLTFFWMAYFSRTDQPKSSGRINLILAFTLLVLSTLLSLSIEFTQLFFPPRTVSLNDLIAESIGGFLGIILYWQFGRYAISWLNNWEISHSGTNKFEQLLYLYLFILFGYSLLPLDLTISPIEVYHKWTEGKVYFIPFASSFSGDISENLYNFFADIAIWIPVSLLWVSSKKKTPSKAILWTWTTAFILEVLQLFVYSRVTDTTDLITAAMAAWLGVKIAIKLKPDTITSHSSLEKNNLWLPIALVLGWSIFLLAIYWYPFNFQSDVIFLKERLAAFLNVPFTAFYYGTEYRAITSFLSKTAFFFPLGFLLAALSKQLFLFFKEKIPEKLFTFLSMIYITVFGLMVELGQVALPEKFVDSADWLVSIAGSILGYSIYRYIQSQNKVHTPVHSNLSAHPLSSDHSSKHLLSKNKKTSLPEEPHCETQSTEGILLSTIGFSALGYFFLIAAMPLIINFLAQKKNNNLLPMTDWLNTDIPILLIWSALLAGILLGIQIHHNLTSIKKKTRKSSAALIIISTFITSFSAGFILFFSASLFAAVWAISFVIMGFLLSWPLNTLLHFIPKNLLPAPQFKTELIAISILTLLFLILPTLNSDHFLHETLQRSYILVKSIILWVPLAALAAMTGISAKAHNWIRGIFWSFWIIFVPVLMNLSDSVLFEILAIPLGWTMGVWLVQGIPAHGLFVQSKAVQDKNDTGKSSEPAKSITPVTSMSGTPLAGNASSFALKIRHFAALLLLMPVLFLAQDIPQAGIWIAGGLLIYAILLVRFPSLWLLVIPWALPVLDFAPWSGRIYLDSFDLIILTTLTSLVWHGLHPQARPFLAKKIVLISGLFALTCFFSLWNGLLPLAPFDDNAFSNYHSHYNALRIGKGFLWAFVLIALFRWRLPPEKQQAKNLFLTGTTLGLLSVGIVGIKEHWLFAGLFNFDIPYRITASFSSMHTGGGHIEAYLAAVLPLVAYALWKTPYSGLKAIAIPAILSGTYLLVATVARGALLGLASAVFIWLAALPGLNKKQMSIKKGLKASIIILVIAGILLLGLSGDFIKARFNTLEQDADIRFEHWSETISIMDSGIASTVSGMGLGSFPRTYMFLNSKGVIPASYRLERQNNNSILMLGFGETLYMSQKITLKPKQHYQIKFRIKALQGRAKFNVTLCERHLLHSRQCLWPGVSFPADGEWHNQSISIKNTKLGYGNLFSRASMELSLYNPNKNIAVWVDDIQLIDQSGDNLLQNGNFSNGLDFWFSKTHEHLSWHSKNLWVAIFFEQGIMGVVLFTLLLFLILLRLIKNTKHSLYTIVSLSSLGAFLTIAVTGSLFDAPRLTVLFFMIAFFALWQQSRHKAVKSRQRKNHA
ncbi:MAG: VanZ family protein [Thiotrichaceae bacterium]|nr:VanZ family protein [Thiotrichaceae bacterium]